MDQIKRIDDSTASVFGGICFENHYVIVDNDTRRLIALGHVTGDPYLAPTVGEVKFWPTLRIAENFRKTMRKENEWTICSCKLQLEVL